MRVIILIELTHDSQNNNSGLNISDDYKYVQRPFKCFTKDIAFIFKKIYMSKHRRYTNIKTTLYYEKYKNDNKYNYYIPKYTFPIFF
ncbi:hypothetical protein AZ886_03165 [Staphylococcus epidermidis]|nr:hypothetical protein BKL62_04480 [Staphylococcus epidermidis]RTE16767.1 hypothetical protein BKL64_01320 [Staphylococcus epidermidis]RTE17011.1 hypothetical protein BKL63_03430 [Staphylococcus epidermidis]RTE19940.1 hypothetical protein BKL71_08265 [Staphylococcus epidermidis]RTE20898.1 hypothetical protein BKL66_07640 [Staphylococcus epidermidis]